MQENQATDPLVTHWPIQPWWPYLANILMVPSIVLARKKDTLYLPSNAGLLRSLHRTLKLLLCHLSGNSSRITAFNNSFRCYLTSMKARSAKAIQVIYKDRLYCCQLDINPVSQSVVDGLNFLGDLYQKNLSSGIINTFHSALSIVIFPSEVGTFGNDPRVVRFLKGVFTTRPFLPQNQEIWDVSIALTYLKTRHPPESLSLKLLTLKTTMLLELLSGVRCQTTMPWIFPT